MLLHGAATVPASGTNAGSGNLHAIVNAIFIASQVARHCKPGDVTSVAALIISGGDLRICKTNSKVLVSFSMGMICLHAAAAPPSIFTFVLWQTHTHVGDAGRLVGV